MVRIFAFIIIATAGFLTFWSLIPVFQARFCGRWRQLRQSLMPEEKNRQRKSQARNWPYQHLESRLQRAGYFDSRALPRYGLILAGVFMTGVILAKLSGHGAILALVSGLACIALLHQHLAARIAKRKKAFERNLYKVYRFLNMQVSAGVKVQDALRGLAECLQDPIVKPVFLRFAASYELTLDLEQAMQEVRRAFPGSDCELLATHLRQILQTGQIGKTMRRMEDLLFSRYFSHLQNQTERFRQRLLWLAILALLPVLLFILYPLFHAAAEAVRSLSNWG